MPAMSRAIKGGLVATLLLSSTTACGPSDDRTSYVAIGDSYTAGAYLGRVDGLDGCGRSRANYPHLLAEAADLDLEDVSCSSATTRAVFESQTTPVRSVAPQIDAVDADTDLVTIRIGFNDFGLSARVFTACPGLAAQQPAATAPCTAADRAGGAAAVQPSLDQLPDRLREVTAAVLKKAPDAQVVLIGYPSIFPADEPCANLPLAPGDLPLVRHVVEGINAAESAVADELGLTFVDMTEISEGHDICGAEPWIAGATNDPDRGSSPWHPYREEQQAVADLLRAAID